MTYLFWSFAVVWIGLFAYVRLLMRRTRALEEDVRLRNDVRLLGRILGDTTTLADPNVVSRLKTQYEDEG